MTTNHTSSIPNTLAAIAFLLATSGTCIAQQSKSNDTLPASPITLTSVQARSIESAYNWLDRDSSSLNATLTPRTIFVETPGVKERTNYLNVQVKSRAKMLEQIARESAHSQIDNPVLQTRGVTNNSIQQTQLAFEARLALADERLIEARDRLAPSLREAYPDIDMHSVQLPDGISAEIAAEALMLTGDYEFVSIDWLCYPLDTTPNDSLFGTQWYHQANIIDSVGAWDFTQGNPTTIIGICDSGVDLDHPDLMGALVDGYNAVDNLAQIDGGNVNDDLVGHGTLVAGAAAAIGNNGIGVAGVGWNFGIMPIKVSNSADGTAMLSEILEGARWASDNGAYTSNCSFAGAEDGAVRSTGGHIRLEGHLLVFAAGNDGLANQTNDWAKVTIVGASNQSDNWATWSHTGIGIDCIAPGVSIRSTNRNGGYSFTTGTSFSAPITAGALMLIHDANPALTADEVEFTLLNTCDDKQAAGQDDQTGWGRINVGQAINDAIFGPSIINLPFDDSFPDETLPTQWRNPIGDVIVSTDGINEPSPPYAMNIDDTDSIETISMRAAFLAGSPAEIRFSTQHRGVEAGESLRVEYLDLLLNWSTLTTITSDGSDQEEFTLFRSTLPLLGMHDQFKLRFVAQGTNTSDDWYIDDVSIFEFTNNELPWEESFENGILLTLDWVSSSASASTDATNEPDGTMSAQMDNQDSMTTTDIDVSSAEEIIYVHFYTQHTGVEAGETLDVEYKTTAGVWRDLITVESDGFDQNQFDLNQLLLPFDAYFGTTALRFTAQGDEPDDTWFLDLVAITTEFIEENTCPADLTDDGILNFFDVAAFLAAFGAQDPIADFTNDGVYNFFDVAEFLANFAAGCP